MLNQNQASDTQHQAGISSGDHHDTVRIATWMVLERNKRNHHHDTIPGLLATLREMVNMGELRFTAGVEVVGRALCARNDKPLEQQVKLVRLSVAELGFCEGASFQDICQKARSIGLDFCPDWAALKLRVSYEKQPRDENIFAVIEPVNHSGDGGLRIFALSNDICGLRFRTHCVRSKSSFEPENVLVFSRNPVPESPSRLQGWIGLD